MLRGAAHVAKQRQRHVDREQRTRRHEANREDIGRHDGLVHGGRPAHVQRFVLATTLSSCYGVYGPPYEHVYNKQHPKREEYANNEKYEVWHWNWNDPHSLQRFMRRVNRIRQDNPALQFMRNLQFQRVETNGAEHPQLLAYTKQHEDNLLLVVVNLDPFQAHDGWVHLPLEDFDLPADQRAAIQNTLNETFSAEIPIRFETAPGLVSGIELTTNGQKVAWSIANYLLSLERGVDELLKEKGKPELKAEPKTEQSTNENRP